MERGRGDLRALRDSLQHRQPPLVVFPRSRLVEEAPNDDVLQATGGAH